MSCKKSHGALFNACFTLCSQLREANLSPKSGSSPEEFAEVLTGACITAGIQAKGVKAAIPRLVRTCKWWPSVSEVIEAISVVGGVVKAATSVSGWSMSRHPGTERASYLAKSDRWLNLGCPPTAQWSNELGRDGVWEWFGPGWFSSEIAEKDRLSQLAGMVRSQAKYTKTAAQILVKDESFQALCQLGGVHPSSVLATMEAEDTAASAGSSIDELLGAA